MSRMQMESFLNYLVESECHFIALVLNSMLCVLLFLRITQKVLTIQVLLSLDPDIFPDFLPCPPSSVKLHPVPSPSKLLQCLGLPQILPWPVSAQLLHLTA